MIDEYDEREQYIEEDRYRDAYEDWVESQSVESKLKNLVFHIRDVPFMKLDEVSIEMLPNMKVSNTRWFLNQIATALDEIIRDVETSND